METVFTNAQLVLDGEVRPGSLAVAEGRITAIGGPSSVPGAVDCEGDLLLPGLIELHTDNLERHLQPRPGVGWPHGPAILAHDAELAGAGITTVFDALRVGVVVGAEGSSLQQYARELASEVLDLRARGVLCISHFLHLRAEVCSTSLDTELAAFGAEDRIGIVSVMDHTPGQRQFRDPVALERYWRGKRGLDGEGFARLVERRIEVGQTHGAANVACALAAARRLGAILASHDDTTPEHVAESAAQGARVAEFPTTPEAARACHAHGIAVMMGAPNLVRGGSHSGNAAAEDLARAGLLDVLSSDYVPAALLMAALQLGDLWGDVARGIATVTSAPARAAALADRGRLAEGLRADLVRVARPGGLAVVRGSWSAGRRVG
ncbi:alpha-D-ribose 1-methylphosphonate 5-triphosphate diphosphatase [Seohaeicola zhoushanensis]|uniref:Phosphonate metabolism protein PhnM n=1 Tax=Seohaeicola zhoushanensis TaxID=1569283 RepID=A0A8J3GVV0_9RHOB|nr:alpha-D-ribose 1-methylphosphonate 5-triphosphate diphosphatase [Seohaeicola zhoushanensis]GHF42950.1 phosphonate metabolism protein PhnM [Seohaeicola zhoushanensis]